MLSSRAIKKHIQSVKNISQITRAMEAVSAVKMRKSQTIALEARPYALSALELLRNLTTGLNSETAELSPLLQKPIADKNLLVVIASDKGLAGSFNSNIFRTADRFLIANPTPTDIISVGKKTKSYFLRRSIPVVGEFFEGGDYSTLEETEPIAVLIESLFLSHQYSKVSIVYSNFISTLKQDPIIHDLLPFSKETLEAVVAGIVPSHGKYANVPTPFGKEHSGAVQEFIFEPSPQEVLNKLLPSLLRIEIFNSMLEGNASEHSSRMMAMKNASENAKNLSQSLTRTFNKARQSHITKELSEISAGANSQH